MNESYNTNLLSAASFYLKQLKPKIVKTTVKECLLENLYFPGLYGLSQISDRFGILHLRLIRKFLITLRGFFFAYVNYVSNGQNGQDAGKDLMFHNLVQK